MLDLSGILLMPWWRSAGGGVGDVMADVVGERWRAWARAGYYANSTSIDYNKYFSATSGEQLV